MKESDQFGMSSTLQQHSSREVKWRDVRILSYFSIVLCIYTSEAKKKQNADFRLIADALISSPSSSSPWSHYSLSRCLRVIAVVSSPSSSSSPSSHRRRLIAVVSSPSSHRRRLIAVVSSPSSHRHRLIAIVSSPSSSSSPSSHRRILRRRRCFIAVFFVVAVVSSPSSSLSPSSHRRLLRRRRCLIAVFFVVAVVSLPSSSSSMTLPWSYSGTERAALPHGHGVGQCSAARRLGNAPVGNSLCSMR
ncbi:hypothetical protein OUZ56_007219 [Daphnia magna]|uniref:Uncharacterized protein n=1 Tax=Daphnia magna TaxID=35525 RepID=A0ABQ9YXY6_9CRUS|nr:hypothetical protein OUZ56_007219 [Daphnia magna]